MIPAIGGSEDPRLVDQLSEIDLTTTSPSALYPCRNDQFVVEKNFHIQVIEIVVVHERPPSQSLHHEIEAAVAQLRC